MATSATRRITCSDITVTRLYQPDHARMVAALLRVLSYCPARHDNADYVANKPFGMLAYEHPEDRTAREDDDLKQPAATALPSVTHSDSEKHFDTPTPFTLSNDQEAQGIES